MKLRSVIVEGDVARVPLDKSGSVFAVVDVSDLPLIVWHNWGLCEGKHGNRYAGTHFSHQKKATWMHRWLTNCPEGMEVDHIDGNGLNNRMSNLRIVTHAQNMQNRKMHSTNTSGFKGVDYRAWCNRWRATIIDPETGRKIHLGHFGSGEEAHAAYAEAATRLHGKFARVA